MTVEDAEEILGGRIKEIQSLLDAQDYSPREILRSLYLECQKGDIKWVSLPKLENLVRSSKFDASITDLLLKNIIQIRRGEVAFQNRLIQRAAENVKLELI